jgi:hypothetical protein
MPVRDAIEKLAYDFLEEVHDGWENEDGASGAGPRTTTCCCIPGSTSRRC